MRAVTYMVVGGSHHAGVTGFKEVHDDQGI